MDMMGNRTVRDLLRERLQRRGSKMFLVFESAGGDVREFSYTESLDLIRRAAAGFRRAGVGKGDAFVLHLANSPEFVFAWFGLMWIGAVAVPSNTANTGPELEHVMSLSEAVGVITSPDHLDMVNAAAAGAPAVKHVVLARTSEHPDGTMLLDDLLASAPLEEEITVNSEDIAELIFTSGTTSKPKAVMLTHANCLHAGEEMAKGLALDADDRLLTTLPMFHVNAQAATVLTALTVGGTCILLEEYRASRFMQQLRAHRATSVSLVAMQVRTLLARPERKDDRDHSVRRCFYALPVSDGEKEEFERRFAIELTYGYGLSEAMMIVTLAPLFGDKRWPSIGLPTINRVIRIVDDHDNDTPAGTPGEIIVAGVPGRTLMKGYYRDPAATKDAVRDGWLRTGDNGYFDQYGYVYFFDRKKDMIKRAGENISASEVEAVLLRHDSIQEAAVIGVPDPIRDEAVHAFVATTPGTRMSTEDVLEHCRDHLAAFKIPTSVAFLDALPKTSIGKIEKKVLRQLATESQQP